MTEIKLKKVQTVSTISPTVEVPTNQQQQVVEKKYIGDEGVYWDCKKKKTILKGITTSRVEPALKGSKTQGQSPYPARVFLKVDENQEDIPVFFRIKEKKCQVIPCPECNYPKRGNWIKQTSCQTQAVKHQVEEVWIKPSIKKGSYLSVEGHFDNPIKSNRKSFTAYSYQLLGPNFQGKLTLAQANQAFPQFEKELGKVTEARKYLESHE